MTRSRVLKSGSRKFSDCRFCPSCGTESIERDFYFEEQKGYQRKHGSKQEWLCTACGYGFQLTPSIRHQQANAILKQHRAKNFVDDVKSKPPGR